MPPNPQMTIGLAGWVLQDGNYRDFRKGDRRSFALEFFPVHGFEKTTPTDPACSSTGKEHIYEVTAQVVYTKGFFVLDFGLLAYDSHPHWADGEPLREGDFVTAQVALSVDHFAYFEEFAKRPEAPALIYDWRITRIAMDTTPLITVSPGDSLYPSEVSHQGPRRVPDESRASSRAIDETRKWDDSPGGAGYYFLTCALEAAPPSHSLRLT